MTATTAAAYRLTGITTGTGNCDHCNRELTQRVFTVAHKTTGETLDLGRRCAAKATGYAANAVERQAAIAARIAEVNRRCDIIAAAFPDLAIEAQDPHSTAYYIFYTAATEDGWWGGRSKARGTWQQYLEHHTN